MKFDFHQLVISNAQRFYVSDQVTSISNGFHDPEFVFLIFLIFTITFFFRITEVLKAKQSNRI